MRAMPQSPASRWYYNTSRGSRCRRSECRQRCQTAVERCRATTRARERDRDSRRSRLNRPNLNTLVHACTTAISQGGTDHGYLESPALAGGRDGRHRARISFHVDLCLLRSISRRVRTSAMLELMLRLRVRHMVIAVFLASIACHSKAIVDCNSNPGDGDRCAGLEEGYVCRQGYSCYIGCAKTCSCVDDTWRCGYRCDDYSPVDGGGSQGFQCGTPPLCWKVCGQPPADVDASP